MKREAPFEEFPPQVLAVMEADTDDWRQLAEVAGVTPADLDGVVPTIETPEERRELLAALESYRNEVERDVCDAVGEMELKSDPVVGVEELRRRGAAELWESPVVAGAALRDRARRVMARLVRSDLQRLPLLTPELNRPSPEREGQALAIEMAV